MPAIKRVLVEQTVGLARTLNEWSDQPLGECGFAGPCVTAKEYETWQLGFLFMANVRK